MITVRLPHFSRGSSNNPELGAAVARAAQRANVTQYEMARLMTYFLQEIVESVCSGKLVSIPGFGMFGAYPYLSKTAEKQGLPPRCYPRFISSVVFRHEVDLRAIPVEEAMDRMQAYWENHGRVTKFPGVNRAMNAFNRMRGYIEMSKRRDRHSCHVA